MTIKELALELEMSVTTVSRVLTGQEKKYRISEKTALRVRKAAKAHNFQPNQVARNLRLRKTSTIGLIIPDISNPFFANLARTIELELRKRGNMVLLCDTKDDTDLEKESLSLLSSRQVDGLLVAPVGRHATHLINDVRVPVLLIDRYFENKDIPYVGAHNYTGAYDATRYLIDKGHRRIACIQGPSGTLPNDNRTNGYRQCMDDHGLSEFIQITGSEFSEQNGINSLNSLLSQPQRPSAIFSLNNQIAIGVLKRAKELNLQVPDTFSLLTFDDQPYFDLLSPAITAIRQPMKEMGKVAVEALFKLLDGEEISNQLLPPTLIERESVIKNPAQ